LIQERAAQQETMSHEIDLTAERVQPEAAGKLPFENMIWIPGGTFVMGSDKHYPEEAPAHEVTVTGFWMDKTAVSNEAFRKFIEATKYVTSAERPPNPDCASVNSKGGAHGATDRYVDLPARVSLYRKGE
jgi:formylglycine-generating enzyme required for sulfatase activity